MSNLVWMLAATIAVMEGSAAFAQQMLWVMADELNRRSCPDATCPIVGRLFFQESAQIHERNGEWPRITAYYIDTGCALSGPCGPRERDEGTKGAVVGFDICGVCAKPRDNTKLFKHKGIGTMDPKFGIGVRQQKTTV